MTRIIKKYPNRRLYDTAIGTYITLEDIKKLVLDRVEFNIIDVKTEKDITQSMLLQIISEQEASATPIFTVAMLQDFIRAYHEKSQNLFSEYLEQTMNLFLKQKEFLENQWPFKKPTDTKKEAKKNPKNKKNADKSDG
ncbi:MAG: polyhydroxyalkanoate synthesis repressor PhaR [Gammaproteobacteria bacterium]